MTLINMYPTMLERFIRYAKINTRSDLKSATIPTTKSQWEFLEMLRDELVEYGFTKVELDPEDSYLVALLPSNLEEGSTEFSNDGQRVSKFEKLYWRNVNYN